MYEIHCKYSTQEFTTADSKIQKSIGCQNFPVLNSILRLARYWSKMSTAPINLWYHFTISRLPFHCRVPMHDGGQWVIWFVCIASHMHRSFVKLSEEATFPQKKPNERIQIFSRHIPNFSSLPHFDLGPFCLFVWCHSNKWPICTESKTKELMNKSCPWKEYDFSLKQCNQILTNINLWSCRVLFLLIYFIFAFFTKINAQSHRYAVWAQHNKKTCIPQQMGLFLCTA